jgi:light-independent protochlorophyllide reductase subunit B
MGFEGANVMFDTWVHPLMMGLEEHLIGMFRGDFEFHEDAAPSHLGSGHAARATAVAIATAQAAAGHHAPEPVGDNDVPAATEATGRVATHEAVAQTAAMVAASPATSAPVATTEPRWAADAEKELQKIPFFVRGKARRNTERFAAERSLTTITVDTIYDAKAHFGR